MNEQLDILNSIIEKANNEQSIELQHLNISAIFISDPLFFILPNNEAGKDIWVRVSHNVLSDFLGQEITKSFLENFKEKNNSIIICEKLLLNNITIKGKIIELIIPTNTLENVKAIDAISIEESLGQLWKRGSLFLQGEEKSFLQINEGLRKRIASGLQRYVNTNIFGYLNNEILEQFQKSKEKKYLVMECEICGKVEIYHVFELANKLCNSRLCRKCGKSKYISLINVPFSDTLLVDIFSDFTTFFDKFMHKGNIPPDELINKLLRFSKLDHQLEIGVVYDDLRNAFKKIFQENNYNMMMQLEKIMDKAKENKTGLKEFLNYDEKFSTIQSFQTTSDMSKTYESINRNTDNKYKNLYFPNPVTACSKDGYVDLSEISEEWFNSVINLYKDTFDLIGDHWFLSNLAKVIKKAPIIDDCITQDLYGENLLNKTLRYTKNTELYDIVKDVYNVKIRNAIAHPGRVIDQVKKEIHIYDKGELLESFTLNDFQKIVEKLITFHLELTYVKYRLAMLNDEKFLGTGGILSFQPDFYTKQDEDEKPHLIINQLSNFKKYAPSYSWWKENINIDVVEMDKNKGIRFFINRSKSNYFESPLVREVTLGISKYIKEWIELILKQGELIVTHRYCYIPIDITAGEKNFQWIPVNIPIYPLDGEHEIFIKSMSECGTIKITDEMKGKLNKLIESLS